MSRQASRYLLSDALPIRPYEYSLREPALTGKTESVDAADWGTFIIVYLNVFFLSDFIVFN